VWGGKWARGYSCIGVGWLTDEHIDWGPDPHQIPRSEFRPDAWDTSVADWNAPKIDEPTRMQEYAKQCYRYFSDTPLGSAVG